jgi:hypothetical protein
MCFVIYDFENGSTKFFVVLFFFKYTADHKNLMMICAPKNGAIILSCAKKQNPTFQGGVLSLADSKV